jgi:hypothetical protein
LAFGNLHIQWKQSCWIWLLVRDIPERERLREEIKQYGKFNAKNGLRVAPGGNSMGQNVTPLSSKLREDAKAADGIARWARVIPSPIIRCDRQFSRRDNLSLEGATA